MLKLLQNIKKKLMASVDISANSTVVINGKTYHGKNVSVIDNQVYIDGQLKDSLSEDKLINITVNGDAYYVSSVSGNITVKGDVENTVTSASGDIDILGNVEGSVETVSGNVQARNISGPVKTISGCISK